MTLYVPTVHLNGTSKEALIEQQTEIHNAAMILLKKLADATPHDRDYYVQKNPKAGAEARKAHSEWMTIVRDIITQSEARAIAIQEQPAQLPFKSKENE
jgi:hypothetical protein